MTAQRILLLICAGISAVSSTTAQVAVHVEAMTFQPSRPLSEQSKTAIIRDYLHAWNGLQAALEQNQPELLEADFVGTAKDKLVDTVRQQGQIGIRTRYQDRSHDLQIVFYSPDGLSVELVDKVEYDVQLMDHDKVLSTHHESARYLVVLAPAEVRWRVRVFQSTPE